MRAWVCIIAVCLPMLVGCRCQRPLEKVAPTQLTVTPQPLAFGATYVTQRTSAEVTVANSGASTSVAVSVEAPFAVAVDHVDVGRGEVVTLKVTFAPTEAGESVKTLVIGETETTVAGTALAVPECQASGVCRETHFDFTRAQCLESNKLENSACESSCVVGVCLTGECVGALKTCDDHDACTVDACGVAGSCSYLPKECAAPTSPCQVAVCDSKTGCGFENALDGTLCGPDDCLVADVNICLAGACVTRARPTTGRCSNRWLAATMPARGGYAVAYDAARTRVVLFGGFDQNGYGLGDTWEWDGQSWLEQFPAASPSPRGLGGVAYDALRKRVVLVGGQNSAVAPISDDLWEWDGRTWFERVPPPNSVSCTSSPDEYLEAVYDSRRHRVAVLKTGATPAQFDDAGVQLETTPCFSVREWDGRRWEERAPLLWRPAPNRIAREYVPVAAFDGNRNQVVVIIGPRESAAPLPLRTFEWNGTTDWHEVTPTSRPDIAGDRLVATYDARRARVVVTDQSGGTPIGLWEWDGTEWFERHTSRLPLSGWFIWPAQMAYDLNRRRVVLIGATNSTNDVWELEDTNWERRWSTPPQRYGRAIAEDRTRQRVVLFGGSSGNLQWDDTWEWNGTRWSQLAPPEAPAPRYFHALASTEVGVILFGGYSNSSTGLDDTWQWDGATWSLEQTGNGGSRRSAMAYDRARHQVVRFDDDGTFEWGGGTWVQRVPAHSPPAARVGHSLAYDERRQVTVLFGGSISLADGGSLWLNDTWEWDGTDWNERAAAHSPSPRRDAAMAYDGVRQRVVLLGGSGSTETWEWDGDGMTWLQRMPLTSPPAASAWYLRSSVMTYDAARSRLTLVQGANTWVYVP